MTDICFTPAKKLAQLIRSRKLSATEVMRAFIAQIERVNPKVNAIVTFVPDLALSAAKKFDRNFKTNKGKLLAGLPIAYKDLVATKGIRTTKGSPLYRAHVPDADGSDLAASLRNPGNYCNVVGFRPTPGRVPNWPASNAWNTLSVLGPLARTVADAAFLLSAMAGPDPRVPTSIAVPGKSFGSPLARDFKKTRIAWSRSLGGLPMDPRVGAVLEKQRRIFTQLGCSVEEAEPDFSGATESFEALRALAFLQNHGQLYREKRAQLKQTVIWNIEQGLKLSPQSIARAETLRTQLGNYLDWMKSCYYITITSHPAISVPAGFTHDPRPLPVGLQIVGRYRDDFGVLQLAHAFEGATQQWTRRPAVSYCVERSSRDA